MLLAWGETVRSVCKRAVRHSARTHSWARKVHVKVIKTTASELNLNTKNVGSNAIKDMQQQRGGKSTARRHRTHHADDVLGAGYVEALGHNVAGH